MRHDTRGLSDAEILARLGMPEGVAAEGMFFPDTYLFARGESDLKLLARAQEMAASLANGPAFAHAMTKKMLHQEWNAGVDEAIEMEAQAQAALEE